MRSRTGCLTCRNRKLKCDEQKPVCKQCTKANRNCVASPGVVFRHQQNASLNGEASNNGLKNFYGYKETFGKDSKWVRIPKQLTFIHIENPYEDPGSPQVPREDRVHDLGGHPSGHASAWQSSATFSSATQAPTHGLEALSAAASEDHYLRSLQHPDSLSQLAQTAADVSHVLDDSGHLSPPIDPRLNNDLSGVSHLLGSGRAASIDTALLEDEIKHDDEVPFLLRYFSEGPGAWMDLFDLNSFFAVDVPVKASSCSLLLYAAIALSAKALGRIRISAQYLKQSASKRTPSQWSHKARCYYDLAINLLRQALEQGTRPGSRHRQVVVTPNETVRSPGSANGSVDTMSQWREMHSPEGRKSLPGTDSDELMATTAILCVYEFLDASGAEWSRHLDGAKSLFDIARDGALPLTVRPEQVIPPSSSSKGRRAVFWNVCRQELIDSFINNKETRLDTSDLDMWQSAGLHISHTGYILPSNQPETQKPMGDDMISNALIWLTMKLVNFIAAGDEFPHELGLGIRQKQLLEYWESLERQLNAWYEGLPESFRPTSTVWPDRAEVDKGDTVNIPKKWFARAMCASTMQSYHFAKIQLLANKPHLSTGLPYTASPGAESTSLQSVGATSLAQRHASYATILHNSRRHAEDIVSISLALSNDSARIHSVQPLYTAGQVLGNNEDRALWEGIGPKSSKMVDNVRICVLNLLQGIQRETGWATEYRMQHLLEQWGLPARERQALKAASTNTATGGAGTGAES